MSQGYCEIGVVAWVVVFIVDVDSVDDNVRTEGTEVGPVVGSTVVLEGVVGVGWVAEHVPQVGSECFGLSKRWEAALAHSATNGDEHLFAGGLTCLDCGSVGRAVIDIRRDAVFGSPASRAKVGGWKVVGRKVFVDEGHVHDADVGILTDVEEIASI